MTYLISCAFNMDTACMELKFANGSMILIDTIAVENEAADNMYQRPEPDYLIYNAPLEYANLILNKAVTEYKRLDSGLHPPVYFYHRRNFCSFSLNPIDFSQPGDYNISVDI